MTGKDHFTNSDYGWEGTTGQILANMDYGDGQIGELFQFYKEHLDDWENGNSEFEQVTFWDDPVEILKTIYSQFRYAFWISVSMLRNSKTVIKYGGERQPHFQHLEGLRLNQAVLFGTIWEQEVPADRNE